MTVRQFAMVVTYDDKIPSIHMESAIRSLALLGCELRFTFPHIRLTSIAADGEHTGDLIGSITMGMMGGAYVAAPADQDLFWSAAEIQRRGSGG